MVFEPTCFKFEYVNYWDWDQRLGAWHGFASIKSVQICHVSYHSGGNKGLTGFRWGFEASYVEFGASRRSHILVWLAHACGYRTGFWLRLWILWLLSLENLDYWDWELDVDLQSICKSFRFHITADLIRIWQHFVYGFEAYICWVRSR